MKRKFSLDIVFIFTLLIVVTITGIIAVVYSKNKKIAMDSAKSQFQKEAQTLIDKTDNYMKVAQLTAEVATQVFDEPGLTLKLKSEQSSYLLKALLSHKQIALLYFGDEKGSYLQAADFGGKTYVKVIHRKNNKAQTVYNYYDKNVKITGTESFDDTIYDPRMRPWYIGAKATKKVFWTDPYIFFENGRPGITVAVPIFAQDQTLSGVVAADITLDGLSDFLKRVDLTKNGIAFICDAKGQLLAFSGKEKTVVTENGKVRSLKPEDLKIPEITAAMNTCKNTTKTCASFSSNGENYLVSILPFPDSFGKQWTFAILAPENDFTGAMKATLRQILYLSIGGLAIGILLTMFWARRISLPIELLSKDVLRVRNFDLDSDSGVVSHIHEIQTMDNAIKAMKTSLKAFRLYLPSVLVKQLIESGEDIAIGGKESELTVFFSDIKDFTSISEHIPPKDLMLQLSEYFDAMTTIIENDKGTVDKFIGDAVMAFWGAPTPNANHTADACLAALQCQRAITKLNIKWEKEGKDQFYTRIGIHSASVIVGNMGSEQRMNYTVLGDGVNLASRLEGVNKIYKTAIIISESTYLQVKNLFECRILDQIAVKGKNEAVKIYELLIEHDSPEAEKFANFAKSFEKIYEIYLKREWQKAKELFEKYLQEFPDDYVCKLYIDRSDKFIKEEPPSDWKGVTKLDTK